MHSNQNEELIIFLTTEYVGKISKKPLSLKTAQDCIYRLKIIENKLGIKINWKSYKKVEKMKEEIKLKFNNENQKRAYPHTNYIFALNMLIRFIKKQS
jgi:hypothetical protein